LEETKKLIEEVQKAERFIRQKVFNHIFNNIDDIAKTSGGNIFLNSIIGDNNHTSKLDFAELKKQKEELEAKLLEKKDNNKSLDEINNEITQKKQSLLETKKELLTIKEVVKG